MDTFANRLNEALKKRHVTPAELSRATKISEPQISSYRRGAYKATQQNLEKIAEYLLVPIPWIMGYIDDSPFEPIVIGTNITTEEKSLLEKFRTLNCEDKRSIVNLVNRLANTTSAQAEKEKISSAS